MVETTRTDQRSTERGQPPLHTPPVLPEFGEPMEWAARMFEAQHGPSPFHRLISIGGGIGIWVFSAMLTNRLGQTLYHIKPQDWWFGYAITFFFSVLEVIFWQKGHSIAVRSLLVLAMLADVAVNVLGLMNFAGLETLQPDLGSSILVIFAIGCALLPEPMMAAGARRERERGRN